MVDAILQNCTEDIFRHFDEYFNSLLSPQSNELETTPKAFTGNIQVELGGSTEQPVLEASLLRRYSKV